MYIYIYIFFLGYHVSKKQCLISNDVVKEAERHIDRDENADAYRFVLCQFVDEVDSSTGRAWRKCVEDLDAYITNHLGV